MKNINKKYILIIGGFLLVVVVVVLLIIEKESKTKTTTKTSVVPTIFPTKSFLVTSTVPKKDETDVYPGEIQISFTSDTSINYATDFSFYLSPPPKVAPKLISSFPTKTVTYQVLGGLERNMVYTVFVNNKHSQNAAIWSFKTSGEKPESSSAQALEEQKKLNEDYYPLFDHIPYENENFQIDYTGRLTLLIVIKKNNIEDIKKEALEWINSKGVKPSTHTINYKTSD